VHARLFGVALPDLKLGRFTLLRRVGAGGMGVVYAARDDQLEREVALKLLHPQLGGREATTRLLREARAMARLSHPNVVQLYDVGEHDGRVFVTMEFIVGQTLRAWQNQAPRGWREIIDMYIQAGKGVAAAHRAGLVHRDFKPENAFVGDDDGRLRVLDFGLASPIVAGGSAGNSPADRVSRPEDSVFDGREGGGDRLTVTGMHLGTPGYAAPELRGGVPATPRADQFSFCVALYEALHGYRPGAEQNGQASGREVPPWINAVLARGYDPVAQRRWSSMAELLGHLGHNPARTSWRRLALVGGVALILGLVALVWVERGRGRTQREALIQAQSAELERADAQTRAADAEARREAGRAQSSRLATLAQSRGVDDPVLGLLLASEAAMANVRVSGSPLPEGEQVLRDALAGIRSRPLLADGTALVDVAVGPLGSRVVTAGRDGSLRVWELAGGEAVAHRLGASNPSRTRVTGLALSSQQQVAAGFADGGLALWNLSKQTQEDAIPLAPSARLELADDSHANGQPSTEKTPLLDLTFFVGYAGRSRLVARSGTQAVLLNLPVGTGPEVVRLPGHTGRVRGVRPGPDGRLVATWASDGVRLWRVEQGTLSRHIKMGKGTRFPGPQNLDIRSDASQLLVAGVDGSTRIWPLAGGRPQVLATSSTGLRLARFTSGGLLAVTVSEDQRVRTWELNPRGGHPLPPAGLDFLAAAIGRLAFTPHNDMVVGTPPGGAAYLWSLAEPGAPSLLRGHAGTVVKAAFDAQGKVLATASTDGSARLWYWDTQTDVLRGHPLSVTQVNFIGNGTQVLSAGMDGTARVWSPGEIGARRSVVLAGHREGATVLARAHRDGRIVTASVDGTFATWTPEGEVLGAMEHLAGEPTDLALGPGGLQAIGTREGVVDLRRLDARGQVQGNWSLNADASVTRVAFAAHGKTLLAASETGSVQTWSLADTQPVPGPSFTGHRSSIYDVAVAPDGASFATASEDQDVRTWSLDHPQSEAVFHGHEGSVWSVVFDHTGERLLTASSDTTARLWHVDAPGEPSHVLRGHTATVWNAAFSPDGTRVVTSSADGTARLWNLGSGTVVVLPHDGTAPPGEPHQDVTAAVFNPSGTKVATAAADGVVRVFAVQLAPLIDDACARAGRRLTSEEWELDLGSRPYAPVCP